MLKTITPREMKALEQSVMKRTGVAGSVLMERAAAHVAQAVRHSLSKSGRPGSTAAQEHALKPAWVLCLCGTGNNGGDGLAAMRLLAADGDFSGICWLMDGTLSPDAAHQLNRLRDECPRVQVRHLKGDALPQLPKQVGCVIDALFGTGLSRPLDGMAAQLCGLMNELAQRGVPVISVDIPSGLDGETGAVPGTAVHATRTVTFHRPKPGLYLGQGLNCTGELTVADIGLPSALDDVDGYTVLEAKDLTQLLPPRRPVSHKGVYGRALIWAGSRGMAGAAAICATAALRTGAGLVNVACEDSIVDIVQILCPCATCAPLMDGEESWLTLKAAMDKADALALGCGLGQREATTTLLCRVLGYLAARAQTAPLPAVLDADGLNLLGSLSPRELQAALPGLKHAVLTPHPGEAARLLGLSVSAVTAQPVEAARALRQRYGASVILKGAASVLLSREGVALNVLGTPAMAKGGSGDALTGVAAALLAGKAAGAYALNGLELLEAACGLHGLSGLKAEQAYGGRGVLATDLCDYLGMGR